jgi:DNA-binding IclR family transcriptional regulator
MHYWNSFDLQNERRVNMSEKKAFVQSVDRALQILEFFFTQPSMSLIEITNSMALPKTTVFGLISTLEKRGFLKQDAETKRYQLGIRLMELSAAITSRTDIIHEATRLLKPISKLYGHNAHITMLDGLSVVYVGHVEATGTFSIKTNIGTRAPAYCTSSGKAFLASLPKLKREALIDEAQLVPLTPKSIIDPEVLKEHLNKVESQGYAVDCEESITDVEGVGVVVKNRFGEAVIGLSIAGLATQFSDEIIQEYVRHLRKAADSLRVFIDLQISK